LAWLAHLARRGQCVDHGNIEQPYCGFRFPAEVIEHAVWLYYCFSLSLRDIELILAARGIMVSCESIREWSLHFGRLFADKLKRRRPRRGDKWHMDKIFVHFPGKLDYLWRTVDQDERVLDLLVQSRRKMPARPSVSSASCCAVCNTCRGCQH
jgi:putative transposase